MHAQQTMEYIMRKLSLIYFLIVMMGPFTFVESKITTMEYPTPTDIREQEEYARQKAENPNEEPHASSKPHSESGDNADCNRERSGW
jgi:hypothetical protein